MARCVAAHHGRRAVVDPARGAHQLPRPPAAVDAAEIDELLAAALDELHDTDERSGARHRALAARRARPPARTPRAHPAAAAAANVAAGVARSTAASATSTRSPTSSARPGSRSCSAASARSSCRSGSSPGAVHARRRPGGCRCSSRVPKTDPIAVTVEWDDGAEEVRLRAGERAARRDARGWRPATQGRGSRRRRRSARSFPPDGWPPPLTELTPLAAGTAHTTKAVDAGPACAISRATPSSPPRILVGGSPRCSDSSVNLSQLRRA